MPTFGDALQAERQKRNLTQAQLADASGVPVGTLRDYEQGKRTPSFPNVIKLAAALGVSCEAFAGCDHVTDRPPAKKAAAKKAGRGRK
jgi:transcriptional regulator with XRE-family HTH domain